MASLCQLFAIGQRADKKVTVELQHAVPHCGSATQQEQNYSFESPHSAKLSNFTRSSGLQWGSPFSGHYIENENTETPHSGATHGRYYQREYIPKEFAARDCTFNKVGRDQRNCYSNFVVNNHFYSRETPDDADPGIHKYVVSGGFQATAIVSTTTFVTKNVSVAAPYWGLSDCNAEDLISLTVKTTSVRYSFFSDRYPIPCRNSK